MAVVAHVILRGLSTEDYDRVRTEVGWLESPPEGGYSHVAWWDGDDNHNVDAWESESAFQAFAENRLSPAMGKLGIDVQPEVTFHPAHEVYTPQAVRLT